MSMIAPVRTERVKRARLGVSPLWIASGRQPTMIAIAPVPCIAMKAELVKKAPAVVPTMKA